MTATIDAPEGTQIEAENEATTETTASKRGRNPDRDFTKFVQRHQDLADFINAHPAFVASGLDAITPNQVKTIQLLSEDFRNTPEQIEARKAREAERKQEDREFEGLSAEEKKELKAANRKAKALQEVQDRRQALLDKAKAIREANEASGADLAETESDSGEEPESGDERDVTPGRRPGRNRR